MGQGNIFGRPPPIPAGGNLSPADADADDDLYADDAGQEGGDELDDEPDEEDLDLPGTGSLTGISIRRSNDPSMARPAAQPAAPGSGGGREPAPARNIAEYWSRLRKARRWPARSDIDPKEVALQWPNTMLMKVGTGNDLWRFESLFADVMRGGGSGFGNGEIEFTPMIMDWILNLGRRAESDGTAIEDSDSFPTDRGNKHYKAIAVPLGDDDTTVNYVLCHVENA